MTQASAKPAGRSMGTSLSECTARSARPSSRATSSSLTNRPLPPTLLSDRSRIWSPRVVIPSSLTAWPRCSSSDCTCSACQSANRLSRVAMVKELTASPAGNREAWSMLASPAPPDRKQPMPATEQPPARRAKENERPLLEDIRLLGRILGDVIREQEGVEAFDLVERIRKLSVAFRRDADQEADRALKSLLKSLSGDQAVRVIRAFTYFSHLANLAEDRHHIRRRQVHERAGDTQEGSIEVALARLRWGGIHARTVSQTLAHSYLSPVLTAHPTEVQRKSILDAERDLARLLAERDEIRGRAQPRDALAPKELAANEAQLRARVMQLWQTRLLRFSKLTVSDEIENALSYYEATFLREIPKVYAGLERD